MKNNKLIRSYNTHLASFRKHFKQTAKKLEMEAIHQLRVDIKKLRTILALSDVASNYEFNKQKHFSKFSKLFSKAGKVREYFKKKKDKKQRKITKLLKRSFNS